VPPVLLQHFRGNLDNWDPALADALAAGRRRVVTFDNAGVGGSTGTTPDTIEQMARDAIAFLAAMSSVRSTCSASPLEASPPSRSPWCGRRTNTCSNFVVWEPNWEPGDRDTGPVVVGNMASATQASPLYDRSGHLQ
jgi:hypothetical protein